MIDRMCTKERNSLAVLVCVSAIAFGCHSGAVGAASVRTPTTTTDDRSSATSTTEAPAPIPTQYQTPYNVLASEVESFGTTTSTGQVRHTSSTTMGTELLTANGNVGTGLLRANAIDRVDSELDAFVSLGITGVTVDVSFPLLLSSTPDNAGYLAFYEQVARAVKACHMVLSVEENPIFSGTPLTNLHINYSGLTLASLAAAQRTEAQLIIDHLEPAYLTVLAEPDTSTEAVGVNIDSPVRAVAFVNTVLDGLHRHATLVGAGTGNWSSPAIDEALVSKTQIDYLDVHVYLFGPTALSNLAVVVSAARSSHKQLVMDETWLNKPTTAESSGPEGAPEELKVKSFNFWEPLDEQFVRSMVRYARDNAFRYVSFYDGAWAFFAYLPWSEALETASYAQFSVQYDQTVAANMRAGNLSGTGQVFEQSLRVHQADH
jgi:hypothetical protein